VTRARNFFGACARIIFGNARQHCLRAAEGPISEQTVSIGRLELIPHRKPVASEIRPYLPPPSWRPIPCYSVALLPAVPGEVVPFEHEHDDEHEDDRLF